MTNLENIRFGQVFMIQIGLILEKYGSSIPLLTSHPVVVDESPVKGAPAQKGRDVAVVGLRCNICNGKKEIDGDMVDKWW